MSNEFQIFAAADHSAGHGHVGDDHGIGILCLPDQGGDVGGAGESHKSLTLLLERLLAQRQLFCGNTQRFHNDDLAHM